MTTTAADEVADVASPQACELGADISRHPRRTMQCMEVRGGNEPVDAAFTMPGVDAWVYSRP